MNAHVFVPGLDACLPVLRGGEKQSILTRQFLTPLLPELEAMFLAVREQMDPVLSGRRPAGYGNAYPKGQCLEIASAVFNRLTGPERSGLSGAAGKGFEAFTAFRRNGGVFRRVWGDLRGRYFQNAFQLGTLYVDVANDSVVVTKPKVEILPFTEAGLKPVTDFRHFIRIAESYWGGRFFPNHILPGLAPYCPLIHHTSAGEFIIRARTTYMVWLSVSEKFRHSEDLLRDAPMPAELFDEMRDTLQQGGFQSPASPAQGRAAAVAACEIYRRKRWYASAQQSNQLLASVGRINLHLMSQSRRNRLSSGQASSPESTGAGIMQESTAQQTLSINGTDYSVRELSRDAREQLASIQVVDRRIQELKQELAILQTARNAYASALSKALAEQDPQI